jgi:hypothetical protein
VALTRVFDNISVSSVHVGPDRAPALTISPMGLLDQNLYMHELTPLTSTLKMKAACAFEVLAALNTSTQCVNPRAESTSAFPINFMAMLYKSRQKETKIT